MKTFYRFFLISVVIMAQAHTATAKEGMWIPMLLQQLNEKDMQNMGMRITAKDIYDINHSSLKDAVLLFGGGCTAEIISDEGLVLTNHHCGYRAIQSHSTIRHDYLTDGFWAMNRNEELPNPGLTVTRLVRMEDVTERMLAGVTPNMTEKERDSVIKVNGDKIKTEAENENHYKAYVRAFYYGNEFYLFVTEVFKDVRLVGAPPSDIGKFGGDTDNWMWPRHTGDFSLFRIYVDKDNRPAEYSKENVPYKPLYSIPISLKGVKENDFTFIFGFPGRTQEYVPSYAVGMITQMQNPTRIALRRQKLDIYESYMTDNPEVRIQYSAKYASLSNGWKKWIGEDRGIKKLNGIRKKQDFENAFTQWVIADPERKNRYGELLDEFKTVYDSLTLLQKQYIYLLEAGFGIEIVKAARQLEPLVDVSQNKNASGQDVMKAVAEAENKCNKFYKDYYLPIDRKVFEKMLQTYRENIPENIRPAVFRLIDNKYNGNIRKYADELFDKSLFASREKILALLSEYKKSKYKKILKDPAYRLAEDFFNYYRNNIRTQRAQLNTQIDSLMRIYMKAQMEMQPDKLFYPDANSTLRVAYGKVKPYYPRDAVFYDYRTTLRGIMEKENPDIYDYVVEDKLKQLYADKDFGKYGENGRMPVCFIATNHTTGGNSGSPALNADGELIGVNFDRDWEGTMSDLMFDPDQCRNIMLDIRYFLFIVDKFAGAGHLVREMNLVE